MDSAVSTRPHAETEAEEVPGGDQDISSPRKAIIAIKQSSSDIAEEDGECVCVDMCDRLLLSYCPL